MSYIELDLGICCDMQCCARGPLLLHNPTGQTQMVATVFQTVASGAGSTWPVRFLPKHEGSMAATTCVWARPPYWCWPGDHRTSRIQQSIWEWTWAGSRLCCTDAWPQTNPASLKQQRSLQAAPTLFWPRHCLSSPLPRSAARSSPVNLHSVWQQNWLLELISRKKILIAWKNINREPSPQAGSVQYHGKTHLGSIWCCRVSRIRRDVLFTCYL